MPWHDRPLSVIVETVFFTAMPRGSKEATSMEQNTAPTLLAAAKSFRPHPASGGLQVERSDGRMQLVVTVHSILEAGAETAREGWTTWITDEDGLCANPASP